MSILMFRLLKYPQPSSIAMTRLLVRHGTFTGHDIMTRLLVLLLKYPLEYHPPFDMGEQIPLNYNIMNIQ